MPFGVRRWPASDDPRGVPFQYVGWQWDAVSPFLWRIESIGALAPFDFLNSGVVLPVTSWDAFSYDADAVLSFPGWPFCSLDISGFDPPEPLPILHTIRLTFFCFISGFASHSGYLYVFEPYPISQFSLPVSPFSGINYVPHGVTLTPVKWDTPVSL